MIKLGLFGVFGAIFFAVLWVNLVVCDRLAGHDVVLGPGGRAGAALPAVRASLLRPDLRRPRLHPGAHRRRRGRSAQWQNWILFRHGGNFGVTDPQFHKDVGFYVFKLPFLTFVVDWTLAILIVTLAVVGGLPLPQRRHPARSGASRGCGRRSRRTSRCCWR